MGKRHRPICAHRSGASGGLCARRHRRRRRRNERHQADARAFRYPQLDGGAERFRRSRRGQRRRIFRGTLRRSLRRLLFGGWLQYAKPQQLRKAPARRPRSAHHLPSSAPGIRHGDDRRQPRLRPSRALSARHPQAFDAPDARRSHKRRLSPADARRQRNAAHGCVQP